MITLRYYSKLVPSGGNWPWGVGRGRLGFQEVVVDLFFLPLKKFGIRQYEDSDCKTGVGVSTQARGRGCSGHAPKDFFQRRL